MYLKADKVTPTKKAPSNSVTYM